MKKMQALKSAILNGTKKYVNYINKHSLLISYKERRKGIVCTLFGWLITAIFTSFLASSAKVLPNATNFLLQAAAATLFLLLYALFYEGFDSLKLSKNVGNGLGHFTSLQRLKAMVIRGLIAIIGYIFYDLSKLYSFGIDNTLTYGTDALIIAFILHFLVKDRINKTQWIFILVIFVAVTLILRSDISTTHPWQGIKGAFYGLLASSCFAIIFFMASIMIHHDKPVTIAFYQCSIGLIFSIGYFFYSYLIGLWENNYSSIEDLFSLTRVPDWNIEPILQSVLTGILYAIALLLFLKSFYYTEIIILAFLGYFLAPFSFILEWLTQNTPLRSGDLIYGTILLIGTVGLTYEEKKKKRKEKKYLIPHDINLTSRLTMLFNDYQNRLINKNLFLASTYEFYRLLYKFCDLISRTKISCINIYQDKLLYSFAHNQIIFEDDGSYRCTAFEALSFGDSEPEILEIITYFMQDQSIFFDIGAGTGWYTINVARHFPEAKIYSFELVKSLYSTLNKNLDRNAIVNVEIECLGLGDTNETINFHYSKNHNEYLKNIIDPKISKCNMRKLDDIIDEKKIFRVDVIKQELKGDESSFIEGGFSTIKKFSPLILISLHEYWNEDREEILHQKITLLKSIGYECVILNGNNPISKAMKEEHFLLYHPKKHDKNEINRLCDQFFNN